MYDGCVIAVATPLVLIQSSAVEAGLHRCSALTPSLCNSKNFTDTIRIVAISEYANIQCGILIWGLLFLLVESLNGKHPLRTATIRIDSIGQYTSIHCRRITNYDEEIVSTHLGRAKETQSIEFLNACAERFRRHRVEALSVVRFRRPIVTR